MSSITQSQSLANIPCSSKNISETKETQAPIELVLFEGKQESLIEKNTSSLDNKIEETIDSENLLKQERKEKARLFMERILNEKLAAKKKQNELETNLNKEKVEATETQSSIVINSSPIEKSTTLNEIIETKLHNVIISSSLLSATVKNVDKSSFIKYQDECEKEGIKKKSKKNSSKNEKKNRKHKNRSRKRSHSRSRSSSIQSNKSDDESDESLYRKKKKKHKRLIFFFLNYNII